MGSLAFYPVDPGMPVVTGTSYYVDASTVGTEVGTIENPFRTLAQASAQSLSAGDAMLFKKGETFIGEFEANYIGEVNNRILYGSYGDGEHPIISTLIDQPLTWTDVGDNVWESVEDVVIITRLYRNNAEIMGAYGAPLGTTQPDLCEWDLNGAKLQVYNDPTSDTFQFASNEHTFRAVDGRGLYFYGLDIRGGREAGLYGTAWEDVTVSYCKLSRDCYYGLRVKNHYFNNGNANVLIDNNFVQSGWTLDYKEAGIDADSFRGAREGMMITDNFSDYTITNNYFQDHCHSAINIYDNHVEGGIRNLVINNNYFTSPTIPYGGRIVAYGWDLVGYEIAYNVFEDQFGAREQIDGHDGYIHHNIWKNVRDSLIDPVGAEGVCIRMNAEHGLVRNNIIENNVFYECQGSLDFGSGTTFAEGGGMELITIRNNIFYNTSEEDIYNSVPIRMFNGNNVEMNRLYTMQNNMSFCTSNALFGVSLGGWEATDRIGVVQFESETTAQGHTCNGNITADPLFVDAEAFMLGAGSPAIGVGLVPLATIDYNGNEIVQGSEGTGYDLGLYNQGSEPVVADRTGMTDIKQGYTTGMLDDFRDKALAQYV